MPGRVCGHFSSFAFSSSRPREDYVDRANRIYAHPFLGLAVFSWPGLRQEFLNWIGHVRLLQDCRNVSQVLDDLRLPAKAAHAYALLEASGQLLRQGFRISFEPKTNTDDFSFHPDALVELPPTGEKLYLEVSCQSLTQRQVSAFDAMAACERPVKEHFELCLSPIILSPVNGPVKMSPYESGDISHESERAAASGCDFILREGNPDVCPSRGAARSNAAPYQAA